MSVHDIICIYCKLHFQDKNENFNLEKKLQLTAVLFRCRYSLFMYLDE